MKEPFNSEEQNIHEIQFGSTEYDDAIALRYEVLRKPLGLHFTPEQLALENNYYHLGFYQSGSLIAYLMLVPESNKMKMKQVVVEEDWQGKGVGAKLVMAAESFAKDRGIYFMYCHARDTAVPFYLNSGYLIVGEMFQEVSIPHYQMEKNLK